MATPTLHSEIERVLRLNGGGPMSAQAIARAVASAGRYRKRDRSPVEPEQIHARVSKHPDRFERARDGIRLREAGPEIDERLVEPAGDSAAPWYWEGNVQASVARFLEAAGWTIESAADTASRERGIDLIATKGARRLAVEVKGYPGVYARGERAGQPKPTAPTTQARHWFAQALLTAVLVGGSGEYADVALAFPDMPRFRDLIARSEWALRRLGIRVFLVGEAGGIVEPLGS